MPRSPRFTTTSLEAVAPPAAEAPGSANAGTAGNNHCGQHRARPRDADHARHRGSLPPDVSPFQCLRGELTGSRRKVALRDTAVAIRPSGLQWPQLGPPFLAVGTARTRQFESEVVHPSTSERERCACIPQMGYSAVRRRGRSSTTVTMSIGWRTAPPLVAAAAGGPTGEGRAGGSALAPKPDGGGDRAERGTARCAAEAVGQASARPYTRTRILCESMDLGLEGKVALVTGASQGIGFGIARELAREGARVAMSSRTAEKIEAAAAEIGARRTCTTRSTSTRPPADRGPSSGDLGPDRHPRHEHRRPAGEPIRSSSPASSGRRRTANLWSRRSR